MEANDPAYGSDVGDVAIPDDLPPQARAVALLLAGTPAEARAPFDTLMADGRAPHLLRLRGRAALDAGDARLPARVRAQAGAALADGEAPRVDRRGAPADRRVWRGLLTRS